MKVRLLLVALAISLSLGFARGRGYGSSQIVCSVQGLRGGDTTPGQHADRAILGSAGVKMQRERECAGHGCWATTKGQDCRVTYLDRIVRDPAVCAGQPVIRGTRVLVRVLLGYLAHGETTEHILREFPSLAEEDVRAVIAFAAASAGEDLPAPSPIPPNAQVA